ncbi:hypothetical protein ABT173_22000 [Streptomyces sp. NPDC001795]|uniref:hypothetical protein n=1 Tax=unclassified Streptomyces TaxID=2593676 RepID=UPI00331B396C
MLFFDCGDFVTDVGERVADHPADLRKSGGDRCGGVLPVLVDGVLLACHLLA